MGDAAGDSPMPFVPYLTFAFFVACMLLIPVFLPSKSWWQGHPQREPCGAGFVMFERQEYPSHRACHETPVRRPCAD